MSIPGDQLILQTLLKVLQLDLFLFILLRCRHIVSIAYGILRQQLLIIVQCGIVTQIIAIIAGVIRIWTVIGLIQFRFIDFLGAG